MKLPPQLRVGKLSGQTEQPERSLIRRPIAPIRSPVQNAALCNIGKWAPFDVG